jgi:hypothetical protein
MYSRLLELVIRPHRILALRLTAARGPSAERKKTFHVVLTLA